MSNQAVLPTIGYCPSTLRAGGKSPTELSPSLPSCWVAAQALDRRRRVCANRLGWAWKWSLPWWQHVPAESCWVTLQHPQTEKPGSAASAFTCHKNYGKNETWILSCSKSKLHKAVFESPWDPMVQSTSVLPAVNVSASPILLQADLLCDGLSTHCTSMCYIRQIFQKGYHFLLPFFLPQLNW